MTISYNSCQS